MRILYVLTSLGMGGAEKLALALCERMVQRGHVVSLMVLMPPVSDEWPASFPKLHLNIDHSPVSFARGLRRARRYVAKFAPDLIHSHSFHANLLARLLKFPDTSPAVVSTIHNVYEGGSARMLAYRLTDRFCLRTVAVSRAAAQRFVCLRAVPAQKCSVIVNGIDLSQFVPRDERRASLRAEMGVGAGPEKDFVWLAAGRIARAKDYPTLLRAFCRVHESRNDAQLWIAGDGAPTAVTLLQSLAAEMNLRGSVRWLGLRRDMPALLDAADGFVSSSAWEGMPLAVGEAMAMEKPVVATDVGGVCELVNGTGVLVPARKFEALARAMLSVMQRSREERMLLGRAAHERVVSEFGMDANADRWEALYRESLARPHTGRA
jgi:glycosyltransferase involved in cell wall biosynthesis